MDTNYIHSDLFIEAAQGFHWAAMRHYQLWFTGQEAKRHRRSETVLRRLSERGKLRAVRYGKKLVYSLPRKTKNFDELDGLTRIRHGLACTECLVRFYRSRMDCEIIPERFFRRCGSVPEFGIRYPNKTVLLCEFSTRSNFLYYEMMNGKINAYIRNLDQIEDKFHAKAIVVFVIDVPRSIVERYVGTLRRDAGSVADGVPSAFPKGDIPFNPFFFTDYETFLKVPIGRQLYKPIYFWAADQKEYPLKKNA